MDVPVTMLRRYENPKELTETYLLLLTLVEIQCKEPPF